MLFLDEPTLKNSVRISVKDILERDDTIRPNQPPTTTTTVKEGIVDTQDTFEIGTILKW